MSNLLTLSSAHIGICYGLLTLYIARRYAGWCYHDPETKDDVWEALSCGFICGTLWPIIFICYGFLQVGKKAQQFKAKHPQGVSALTDSVSNLAFPTPKSVRIKRQEVLIESQKQMIRQLEEEDDIQRELDKEMSIPKKYEGNAGSWREYVER